MLLGIALVLASCGSPAGGGLADQSLHSQAIWYQAVGSQGDELQELSVDSQQPAAMFDLQPGLPINGFLSVVHSDLDSQRVLVGSLSRARATGQNVQLSIVEQRGFEFVSLGSPVFLDASQGSVDFSIPLEVDSPTSSIVVTLSVDGEQNESISLQLY